MWMLVFGIMVVGSPEPAAMLKHPWEFTEEATCQEFANGFRQKAAEGLKWESRCIQLSQNVRN